MIVEENNGNFNYGYSSFPPHSFLLIPLWNQKASKRADGVILWDYHVICIQIKQGAVPPLVWDLDSTLPFPSPLPSYVSETFVRLFSFFLIIIDYSELCMPRYFFVVLHLIEDT